MSQPRGTTYLIHFARRYKHAGHYIGWCSDMATRFRLHKAGRGARLLEVITEAGIPYEIVRIWPNTTRTDERRLKSRGSGARQCPVCLEKPNDPPEED